MKFKSRTIKIPDCDCDLILVFPGGKEITIQCRPSNAEENYAGSLDIILPENQYVCNWIGDEMEPAPASEQEHERLAKQLCTELPGVDLLHTALKQFGN